jgi:hypothetical protein
MRVLAASFEDEAIAVVVRDGLTRRFGLRPGTVDVAPLGRAANPGGPGAVLAGRFRDEVVDDVMAVLADHGGTVVADFDEDRLTG